ncbi:MAG: hypothetical protein MUO30_07490 [Anaerolineales bacterium]|nr:hypothetical protein [Anaerolineales bacterium]
MAKEQIEKTLVILEEAEVRQLLQVAQRNDPKEIQHFMMIFIKKVEAALRRRCG